MLMLDNTFFRIKKYFISENSYIKINKNNIMDFEKLYE